MIAGYDESIGWEANFLYPHGLGSPYTFDCRGGGTERDVTAGWCIIPDIFSMSNEERPSRALSGELHHKRRADQAERVISAVFYMLTAYHKMI